MFYSDPIDTDRRSAHPDARPDRRRGSGLFDPLQLAAAIWRARGFVLFAAVLGACLAGLHAASTPREYTAVSQLVIDPRNLNLVQNEVTESPTGMTTDATLALIESQIAVMTSNSVLGRVVTQTSLTADPEFNGTRTGRFSGLASIVEALVSGDPANTIRNREQVTINALRKAATATRNANSFVVNLAVTSEDPAKAARLANLVTEVFIAEQGRAQSDVARRATAALSSRLAELRQRVVETEGAVETYKAENKLVGVGGRLIDDDYITRINNQLADVRAQITSLNVRAESLRRADVDDVVGGSYPEGLNAESLLRLRQTYSEASQNQAILATRLGPRHPQRIAAEQAVATARRAIAGELSRIVASAQTELARARQTERDLTTQIDALRSRQIETSGAFVRLRELEREVDASRAVYEAYLLRARQTSEQESLNTANVRVISDATMPLDPSSLSRKLVVAAGAVAGLGLGVVLAALAAMLRAVRGRPTHEAARPPAIQAGLAPADRPAPMATAALAETVQPPRKLVHPPTGRTGESAAPDAEPAGDGGTVADTAEAAPAGLAAGWSLRGPADDEAAARLHPAASELEIAPEPAADAPATAPGSEADAEGETGEQGAAEAPEAEEPEAVDHAEVGAPALPPGDDLDERREILRERIRAIGARRTLDAPPLDAPPLDSAPPLGERASPGVEAAPAAAEAASGEPDEADGRRERISLRIAAARHRRRGPALQVS